MRGIWIIARSEEGDNLGEGKDSTLWKNSLSRSVKSEERKFRGLRFDVPYSTGSHGNVGSEVGQVQETIGSGENIPRHLSMTVDYT